MDQKSTFHAEFPQLAAGGDGHHLSSSRENGEAQYGPGPSLRPQSAYLLLAILLRLTYWLFARRTCKSCTALSTDR